MTVAQHATALAALGHPTRLAVFRLLARRAPRAVAASEIATATDTVPSTLSGHLEILVQTGLATRQREGRRLLYGIERARTGALIAFLAAECCRGRPDLCLPGLAVPATVLTPGDTLMTDRPITVLFLCTGNSARSIMAEALLRRLGGARFRALSAGTRPKAEAHPLALATLSDAGEDTAGLRPKNLDEVAEGAGPIDFVFTLCDAAAAEDCPIWPGHPMSAHWGLPDPAAATGTEAERGLAFRAAYRALERRIGVFAALPFAALDRASLQSEIDRLASVEADQAGA